MDRRGMGGSWNNEKTGGRNENKRKKSSLRILKTTHRHSARPMVYAPPYLMEQK